MNEQIKINWYRCKVDKQIMSQLMKTSDLRGFAQVIPQLALFLTTGTLAYLAFRNIHASNWMWSVPLLLGALFVHGTFSNFMRGQGPIHELAHKTPFRSKAWNEFFLKVYSFFGWDDYQGYRFSHVRHHQFTVHHDYDNEVVLPQTLNWQSVKFYLIQFTTNPFYIFRHLQGCVLTACGKIVGWNNQTPWGKQLILESSDEVRRERRHWAQTIIFGHLALATLFIATGHWFLIFLFNFGAFYCSWLTTLCGMPQHIGLSPDVPDFRLCCRTYTCSWLPAFLYWNMQYHVEHHMFPSVPFYNLPKLRAAIAHDLPPATHGLWATWKEIIAILKKQKEDPTYVFIPKLPQNSGDRASDNVLELEAAAVTSVA